MTRSEIVMRFRNPEFKAALTGAVLVVGAAGAAVVASTGGLTPVVNHPWLTWLTVEVLAVVGGFAGRAYSRT